MRTRFAAIVGTVGRLVRLVRDSHRFFVKESPAFVGRVEDGRWAMPWQARLFWPVAWMRFMWLMVREGMRKPTRRSTAVLCPLNLIARREMDMLEKPKRCCDCGTYEHCVPMCVHSKVVYVDYCVARLVAALEAGGLNPVASCCGHGKMPPTVLLEDDTWVMALTREQGEETTARYCTRTDLDDTANAEHETRRVAT